MKVISQRDLDKLTKRKGWELTPESRKARQEQHTASTLSKQVEAITDLVDGVNGIGEALEAKAEKDYTDVINKLTESLKEIKIEPASVGEPRNYRFVIKRGPDGLITEIEAITT